MLFNAINGTTSEAGLAVKAPGKSPGILNSYSKWCHRKILHGDDRLVLYELDRAFYQY